MKDSLFSFIKQDTLRLTRGFLNIVLILYLFTCAACSLDLSVTPNSSEPSLNTTTNAVTIKVNTPSQIIEIEEGSSLNLIFMRTGNTSLATNVHVGFTSANPDLGTFLSNITLETSSKGYRDFTFEAESQSQSIVLNTVHLSTYTGDKEFTISFSSSGSENVQFEIPSLVLRIKDKEVDPTTLPAFTGSICNQTFSTASRGTLYDSGGSEGNYLDNENCTFTITVPSGVVNLRFRSLGVESVANCTFDSIQLFDGADTSAQLLLLDGKNKACGTNLPVPINSTGKAVTIVWRSDGGVTGSGFELEWTSGPDTTPNPFTIANQIDANFNQSVTQTTTVTGFDGTLLASVTGAEGSPEIRNQTSGSAWAPDNVPMAAGDVLEVRMTSPDFYNKTRSAKVTVGSVSADYYLSTVHPPKPADINNSLVANKEYIQSLFVSGGFAGTMTISISGDSTAKIRRVAPPTTWSTSVTVISGDLIEVRMTANTSIYRPASVDLSYQLGALGTKSRWSLFECPVGYIPVHADGVYTAKDFCVMKYEARNVANNATSQETGTIWTNISPTNAFNKCATVPEAPTYSADGTFALISNAEWMTLSRDVEVQPENWLGGAIGAGCFKVGNTAGSTNCSYDGADPESGAGRNSLAMLRLSNGQDIWDLAGNVWEWVDWTTIDSSITGSGGTCSGSWISFTDPYNCSGYFDVVHDLAPAIFTNLGFWASPVNPASSMLKRGGHFDVGDNGTPFAALFNGSAGGSGSTDGFRCVFRPN